MKKMMVEGGKRLIGEISVSGSKNVALKALVASCLTEEEVVIKNVPLISDFLIMSDIIKELGGRVDISDHTAKVRVSDLKKTKISLDKAAQIRTSSMFLAPLLVRMGQAIIPNPGGCRLGARPIDRIIEGLNKMGANISYNSEDGFFYAHSKGLSGTKYVFRKNSHTGTETMIIAGVLASGKTILENAAQEPEVDELITLLNRMGAKIKRIKERTIEITGVEKLHGAEYEIKPDRNEVITFAIASIITKGDIFIRDIDPSAIVDFLKKLKTTGAGIEIKNGGIRFFYKDGLKACDVTTSPHPGFMTDWQAPWAVLMTQAQGESVIHETVFEDKFGYIHDLEKMGADAQLFNPKVSDPEKVYNFNIDDDDPSFFHAVRIKGPRRLHNAVVSMENIRAGAAIVLAALCARGQSTIFGIEKLDRGYEDFGKRLETLGAKIERIEE